MSLIQRACRSLIDPRLREIDWESEERIRTHRSILSEKPMIRDVFAEIYDLCIELDERYLRGDGLRVEIGAGVSFFKQRHPRILSTDIKAAEHLDRAIDAQAMDFEDGAVRAIYGQNCFHHFPQPRLFFSELERVLAPGGGCVLIEPYYGPFAGRFFKAAFKQETFDRGQAEWEGDGKVMLGANQALSYVVFVRDRALFEQRHPALEIVHQKPLGNFVRYLASGGLNFRPLAPAFAAPLLKGAEFALTPLRPALALHHAIVLRKRA
jgi:SAM-dependent methyltransferase